MNHEQDATRTDVPYDFSQLARLLGVEPRDGRRLAFAAAALAAGAALGMLFSRRRDSEHQDEFGLELEQEQATTVRAPLEQVEAAWLQWCASGQAQLKNNYAVRFEPAPGARGTEVHLAGGGSKSTIREELRRFKQQLETGEITVSEGPALWRPAQPPGSTEELQTDAEVL